MQRGIKKSIALLTAMSCLSLGAGTSFGDARAALKNAPAGTNAVMTIDVAKLVQSPFGKSAELQSKLMKGYADSPLAVPATAKSVTLLAGVHPVDMESIWQVAVVDLAGPPKIASILASQGGYVDTVQTKPAGWSRFDVYYVELDTQTMAVVRPAQRQFVNRWLSSKNVPESAYLTQAVSSAAGADVVFAIDMDSLVALPAVRYTLAMGRLPSLEAIEPAQQAKLLAAIATVKGMTLTVRATETLDAEWVIDFGQDVSALGKQAGPFVIDALTLAGVYDGNPDRWNFQVDKNRLVGKGKMELARLSELISLLAPGGLSHAVAPVAAPAAAAGDKPATPPADPKTAAATASQNYYRAIAKSIESIGPKASPTQGAAWLNAQKKNIEHLPILNVDPALLAWGNQVVQAYKMAAQELALGQMKAQNAAMSIQTPHTQGDGYGYGNTYGSDTLQGDSAAGLAAFRDAQQQRRQVAQTEREGAASRATVYFDEIAVSRAKVRAEMTEKYGVEF